MLHLYHSYIINVHNIIFIFSVSVFTLERSRVFVDALFNLTGPFSIGDIMFSALLTQNISGLAISQACSTNTIKVQQ